MRRLLLPRLSTVLAAALIVLPAAPAWAHTSLVSSTPAQGGSAEAPAEVVLVFSDPVQAGLSALSVRGADDEEQVSGSPSAGADGASVTQALRSPLQPGACTVAYRVLAADGHPVTGSFGFTAVVPAGAAAPAPATATGPPTAAGPATEGQDDGSLPVLPLLLGGLAVAVLGGLLARRLGRSPAS